VFKKKTGSEDINSDVAMRIVTDGKPRDVSYRELLLSVNMTMEALMSILAKKNLITPDDMIQELELIRNRRKPDEDSHGDSNGES
jgi:hypothetical protein